MESPLSAVMACPYMKKMESEYFLNTLHKETTCLSYVADMLAINPLNTHSGSPESFKLSK